MKWHIARKALQEISKTDKQTQIAMWEIHEQIAGHEPFRLFAQRLTLVILQLLKGAELQGTLLGNLQT